VIRIRTVHCRQTQYSAGWSSGRSSRRRPRCAYRSSAGHVEFGKLGQIVGESGQAFLHLVNDAIAGLNPVFSSPPTNDSAPDTHTMLSLVGAGAGIGLVPVSAGHLEVPGVVLVPVTGVPPVPLALAWREDDPNPALHALVGLRAEIAAESAAVPEETRRAAIETAG
jgi:DNA-binding transcriptional LysR family regulator